MATEINDNGYESLRRFVDERIDSTDEEWNTIEIVDDTDTAILRVDTSDSRLEYDSTEDDNPIVLRLEVSGDDSEISLPETISGFQVYYEDEDGSDVVDIINFTDVTLEEEEDTLVVFAEIELPEITE